MFHDTLVPLAKRRIITMESTIYDSTLDSYDVTICIITYNRERYIKQAVQSVLDQDTNLKYEILISDNCSQDNTVSIIKEYWETSPEIFHIVLNKNNLGLTKNRLYAMKHAKGDYIVMLDGDDYWINSHKLEVQYKWLISHPEYIGVATTVEARYSDENVPFKILPSKNMRNRKISLDDFLKGYTFSMTGMLFRRELITDNLSHFEKMIQASESLDDGSFCVLFLMFGDVFNLDYPTTAYRIFKPGEKKESFNSSNSSFSLRCKSLIMWNNLDKLTCFELDFGYRIGLTILGGMQDLIKRKLTIKEYKKLISFIEPRYRKRYLKYVTKVVMFKCYSKMMER